MDQIDDSMLISHGQWSSDIRWEYFSSPHFAPANLTTAVCCIVVYDQQIVLIKNRRGWELPGGKIRANETPLRAVIREVQEETGFLLNNPQALGFKKITVVEPVSNPEIPGTFYPFPYSYVQFFISGAIQRNDKWPCHEIMEVKLESYHTAIDTLANGGQYEGILQHAFSNGM